ncbi:HEAT repeat domain-containing protein [Actinacidiphila oryziradicis]|nr:HEAT repeat domain-containing protein [Actinacidiphila oryziradicis]
MRLRGDVEGLCRTVRSGDPDTARRAMEMLADIGDRRASDVLLRCVTKKATDRHWLWLAAVDALGRLQERRAVPLLIGLLERGELENPGQEGTVLRALGAIGGPEAVRVLLAELAQRSPRSVVLQALARLRTPETTPALLIALWRLLPWRGVEAVRVLGALRDPHTVPALLYLAAYGSSPSLRTAALEALTKLPEGVSWPAPAEPMLQPALRDPDPVTARLAAGLLARTPEGRSRLHSCLLAHRPYNPEPARIPVCAVIRDRPDLFGSAEVAALAKLLARAPQPAVRRAAAKALGALGGEEAVAALLTALADERATEAVASVLAELATPPIERLLALLDDGADSAQRRGATVALGLIGHAPAAPLFLPALSPAVPLPLRTATVDALGELRHRPATGPLTALAQDVSEPGRLRARALRALGLIAVPESLPVLLAELRDPTEAVRVRAAEALGAYPTRVVADKLGEAARTDESSDVARAALHALGRIGIGAVPVLRALADHMVPLASRIESSNPRLPTPTEIAHASPAPELLRDLIAALAACPGPAPIPALELLATSAGPRRLRVPAAQAIAERHIPQAVAALSRLLTDCHHDEGHPAALRGLARIGSEQATDAVVAYYANTAFYRKEVRQALTTLARTEQRPPV